MILQSQSKGSKIAKTIFALPYEGHSQSSFPSTGPVFSFFIRASRRSCILPWRRRNSWFRTCRDVFGGLSSNHQHLLEILLAWIPAPLKFQGFVLQFPSCTHQLHISFSSLDNLLIQNEVHCCRFCSFRGICHCLCPSRLRQQQECRQEFFGNGNGVSIIL
jgi:hypothetical protein